MVSEPLLHFIAMSCIKVFDVFEPSENIVGILNPGCTDYMKSELGDKYRFGNIYGTLFDSIGNHDDKYFDVWTMSVWNSFCITGSNNKKSLRVYVNGRIVLQYKDYPGYLRRTRDNIKLMKNLKNDELEISVKIGFQYKSSL